MVDILNAPRNSYIHTPVTTDSPNKHPWMHSMRGCPVVVFIAPFKDIGFGRHTCLDAIRILLN